MRFSGAFSLLFVDTSPSICESLRNQFESSGYQVCAVATMSEALGLLEDQIFDLVVTDFFLPDESGEVLCQHLVNLDDKDRPIGIVLTAKYSDAIVKRALGAGAAACLYKNESTELLFARIHALAQVIRPPATRSNVPIVESAVTQVPEQSVVSYTNNPAEIDSGESENGAGRDGVGTLVTQREESDVGSGDGIATETESQITANVHQSPEQVAETDVIVSMPDLLEQLVDRNLSAQHSVLMLDIEIVAATGDRMALGNSGPMQNLVTRSLQRLYPKRKAQACTEDGKFVLLLTTIKFQDALVLTRKLLQLIPKMVPYVDNMALVTHAGILRLDQDETVDQNDVIRRCESACQKTRNAGKDNVALVLPNNQYLSAVSPKQGIAGVDQDAVQHEQSPTAAARVTGVADRQEQKEQPQTA